MVCLQHLHILSPALPNHFSTETLMTTICSQYHPLCHQKHWRSDISYRSIPLLSLGFSSKPWTPFCKFRCWSFLTGKKTISRLRPNQRNCKTPLTLRHFLISDIIRALIDIIIMSVKLLWVNREVQVRNKGHTSILMKVKGQKPAE